MFNFIKNKLHKIYTNFSQKLGSFFGKTQVDEETLHELEKLLLAADTGVKTTRSIITQLRKQAGHLPEGHTLRDALAPILKDILTTPRPAPANTDIYILVGINGSGKTTFASKLAYHHAHEGKKVLLVAADTFRAAAPEQLKQWAERIGIAIELGQTGHDPAAVVFRGCERFKKELFDIMIIDTAGRLQTKVNLMNELAKIKRVITKQLPDHTINTILTIDSMLGQNSLEQAMLFKESTDVTGIALTKMDG